MIRKSSVLLLLAAVCVLPACGGASAPPEPSLRPRWQVGDRWTVETTTKPIQAADAQQDHRAVVSWQFEVKAVEKLGDRECFRIEAHPQDGPKSLVWVDQKTLMVSQIEAGIVLGGQAKYLTENYAAAGQPSPVFSPLPALPVDLPAFTSGETKGLETFGYEATPGVVGQKAVDEIGFAISVEQHITAASDGELKGLASDPFVKDLGQQPTVGVRMKGPYGEVQQLWKPGIPWPVCSENGTTTSRLVKFQPAKAAGEVQ